MAMRQLMTLFAGSPLEMTMLRKQFLRHRHSLIVTALASIAVITSTKLTEDADAVEYSLTAIPISANSGVSFHGDVNDFGQVVGRLGANENYIYWDSQSGLETIVPANDGEVVGINNEGAVYGNLFREVTLHETQCDVNFPDFCLSDSSQGTIYEGFEWTPGSSVPPSPMYSDFRIGSNGSFENPAQLVGFQQTIVELEPINDGMFIVTREEVNGTTAFVSGETLTPPSGESPSFIRNTSSGQQLWRVAGFGSLIRNTSGEVTNVGEIVTATVSGLSAADVIVSWISEDGRVVGQYPSPLSGTTEWFAWDPHNGVSAVPPSTQRVNAGGWAWGQNPSRLWNEGTTFDINALLDSSGTGYTITSIADVNTSGQILAVAETDSFDTFPVLLTPHRTQFRWTNLNDGLFSVASNWQNHSVPGPVDDAVFDLADTYTVEVDDYAPAGVNSAKVEAGQVTLEFDGDALGIGTLTVGGAGNPAQLTLSGTDEIIVSTIAAASVGETTQIATEEAEEHSAAGHIPTEEVFVLPQGVLKVISEGGILDLDVTDEVVIEGTMEIRDNGRVESGRLIIGDEGREGTVTVVSAEVDRLARIAAGNAVLGDDQNFGIIDGGKGTLEIGANAEAVFAKLIVGDGGEGQITVKDGGRLDVLGEMILADNIGAMGQVDLEGNSRVSVGGKITIGSFAAAAAAFELDSTLNIFDTAQVDAAAGLDVGIFGLVVVQGRDENANATLTLSGDLLMSDDATGVVLAEGGRLEIPEDTDVNITLGVDSQLILASGFALTDRPSAVNLHETATLDIQIGTTPSAPDRVAKVEVYEGSILNATTIQVGSGPFIAGQLIVDTRNTGNDAQVRAETIDVDRLGEFTVANGAAVFLGTREAIVGAIFNGTGTSQTDFANKVIVLTGGTLNFAGMVEVGGALVIDDGGHINTGSSPGQGTLVGDFLLQSGGTWTVEVAGLTPGDEYDQLLITGDATIGGTVVFEFLDGFAPQQGQVFDFLAVTGESDLSGAMFEVRNLAPGFQFDVTPTPGGFQMLALNNGTFVPEPGTLYLISLCAIGIFHSGRAKLL